LNYLVEGSINESTITMSVIKSFCGFLFCLIITLENRAQTKPLQTIAGTVIDQSIKTVLEGATIELDSPNGKKLLRMLREISDSTIFLLADIPLL